MGPRISLFISVIFHPMFVNLVTLLMLMNFSPDLSYGLGYDAKWFYAMFIFITTALIPMFVAFILRRMGQASSIMLKEKDERRIPYLLTAFICLFDFYMFERIHAPAPLRAYILASSAIVVSLLIVNHFSKISIHATSFGAMLGLLVAIMPHATIDVRYVLVPLFFFCGMTLTARLFSEAHSIKQLISGFVVGFCLMFFII